MVYTVTKVNAPQQTNTQSKWLILKEVFLALLFNIPFFTHGVETCNLTTSVHSGHFISSDGVKWSTTAFIVGAGVTAPVYCYLIDRFGRRLGMFCISIVQAATLIPHFLWSNENADAIEIVLHSLAGVSSGGLFTVLPIYIKETSVYNSFCMSVMMVFTTLGYMMKLVMTVEERLYLMVALVVTQFLSMMMMLESPSYLVMKGKYECARENLSKLQLLKENNPNISTEIINLKQESNKVKSKGRISISNVYRTKIWLDAIKIGFVLYTVNILCGSIIFLDENKTLIQLKMTGNPESMLVISSLLGGSICCLICVTFIEKKYLLTIGYVIMTLASGVLAVYTQVDLTIQSHFMVPIVSLAILLFGYGIAWALPTILIVEIYNMEIRSTFIGIIYAYSQIIKLLHVHTFHHLEDYIGIYTLFYIFACVNLYGVVYTLFVVPNTRCKSIKQIEKQLERPVLPA